MRSYRFLWLIWLIWGICLLYLVFPGVIFEEAMVILSGAVMFYFFFASYYVRGCWMKWVFNRREQTDISAAIASGSGNAPGQEISNTGEKGKQTFISSEVVLTGDLESGWDIVTKGQIFGNIRVDGEVRVTQGGQVKGNIYATRIHINGSVEGRLSAGNIILGAEGVVRGEIYTDTLVIEKGGVFNGQSYSLGLNDPVKSDVINISRTSFTKDRIDEKVPAYNVVNDREKGECVDIIMEERE